LESVEYLGIKGRRFFLSLRRHLCLFVLVLHVARDAASLFDVVVDHRHDGVISNAAFARTIIVQHVAGPKPALLHAFPREAEKSDHSLRRGKAGTESVPAARQARQDPRVSVENR
jgi:hypothetical protein